MPNEMNGFVPVEQQSQQRQPLDIESSGEIAGQDDGASISAANNCGRRESSFMLNDVIDQYNNNHAASSDAGQATSKAHQQDVYLNQGYHQDDTNFHHYYQTSDQSQYVVDTSFHEQTYPINVPDCSPSISNQQQSYDDATNYHQQHHNDWVSQHSQPTSGAGQGYCACGDCQYYNQYYHSQGSLMYPVQSLDARQPAATLVDQAQSDQQRLQQHSSSYQMEESDRYEALAESNADNDEQQDEATDQKQLESSGNESEQQSGNEPEQISNCNLETKDAERQDPDNSSGKNGESTVARDLEQDDLTDSEADEYPQHHQMQFVSIDTSQPGIAKYDSGGPIIEYRPTYAIEPSSKSYSRQHVDLSTYHHYSTCIDPTSTSSYAYDAHGIRMQSYPSDYYYYPDQTNRSHYISTQEPVDPALSDSEDSNKIYLLLGQETSASTQQQQELAPRSLADYRNQSTHSTGTTTAAMGAEPDQLMSHQAQQTSALTCSNDYVSAHHHHHYQANYYEVNQQQSSQRMNSALSNADDITSHSSTNLPMVSKLYDPTAEISSALMSSNVDDTGSRSPSTSSGMTYPDNYTAGSSSRCAQSTINKLRAFLQQRQQRAKEARAMRDNLREDDDARASKVRSYQPSYGQRREPITSSLIKRQAAVSSRKREYKSTHLSTTSEQTTGVKVASKKSDTDLIQPTKAGSLCSVSSSSSLKDSSPEEDQPVLSSAPSPTNCKYNGFDRSSYESTQPMHSIENRQLRNRTVLISYSNSSNESNDESNETEKSSSTYGIQTRSSKRRRFNNDLSPRPTSVLVNGENYAGKSS